MIDITQTHSTYVEFAPMPPPSPQNRPHHPTLARHHPNIWFNPPEICSVSAQLYNRRACNKCTGIADDCRKPRSVSRIAPNQRSTLGVSGGAPYRMSMKRGGSPLARPKFDQLDQWSRASPSLSFIRFLLWQVSFGDPGSIQRLDLGLNLPLRRIRSRANSRIVSVQVLRDYFGEALQLVKPRAGHRRRL